MKMMIKSAIPVMLCLLNHAAAQVHAEWQEAEHQDASHEHVPQQRHLRNKLKILDDPRTIVAKDDSNQVDKHIIVEDFARKHPSLRLDPNGSQPTILLSDGRSGSSAIWDIMSTLTGYTSVGSESVGQSSEATTDYFQKVASYGDFEGRWLYKLLQRKQAGIKPGENKKHISGFKWKPYHDSFFSEASIGALKTIAASHDPTIKIVRSRRNPLDVFISSFKHTNFGKAHCETDDIKCLEMFKEKSVGLVLPIPQMMESLREQTEHGDQVDQLLDDLKVPHIDVTYERLFSHHEDTLVREWARLLAFLHAGYPKRFTAEKIMEAAHYVATNVESHKKSLANYHEVKEALQGTQFEHLLH